MAQGVDDEAENRNANAGVSDVKGRPGMSEGNVQVEEEKVGYVSMPKAIGKVTENAREQEAEGNTAPAIRRLAAEEKDSHDDQSDTGERDEEPVVISEGTEGGAGVSHMHKGKEVRQENARFGRIDKAQDEVFGNLIERVEREGKKKENSHRRASTTAAQRSHRSGCAVIVPTVTR